MKKLLLAILLFVAAGFAQDSSQTAKRVWGNNLSPAACTYSATADPVITYNGTLYVCSVGGTFVAAGGGGGIVSFSGLTSGTNTTAAMVCGAGCTFSSTSAAITAPSFVANGAGPWITLTERAPNVTPAAGSDICDVNNTLGPSCSVNGAALSPIVLKSNQAGLTIASADTGTPTITFAANSISFNQPISNTNSVLTTPNLGTPSALVLTNATGTPTSINLSNATSLAAAALPNPTASALGGALATVAYQWALGYAGGGDTTTQNNIRIYPVWVGPTPVVATELTFDVNVADNTANSYDIGLYGPGCLGGASGIPLAVHTGTVAGSGIGAGATGIISIAMTGGGATLSPGWYALAFTSNAASPLFKFGKNAAADRVPWGTSASTTGGGATLPSTITCPATSALTNQGRVFLQITNF